MYLGENRVPTSISTGYGHSSVILSTGELFWWGAIAGQTRMWNNLFEDPDLVCPGITFY